MKKFMMRKMMPMMHGTIENLEFSEKEEMMKTMMPSMMANMNMQEKMTIMQRMMPQMMQDMTPEDMDQMSETMMPMMKEQMTAKGIDMCEMMQTMCPKCIEMAIADVTDEKKQELKNSLIQAFE